MFRPVKHIHYDAAKFEDQSVMVRLNAVAMSLDKKVGTLAREILERGTVEMAHRYSADEFEARQRMGL
jgi:hypothetical protein